MRNRFWLGMTISVSTCLRSSAMPASAMRMRRAPSNWNGLVTTADRQDAEFLGGAGDHRCGAGAGAAAHAGGDEHHVRAGDRGADLLDGFLGRGLADLGLGAGAEAFGEVDAELNAVLGARGGERLRVGVGDDELDAVEAGRDHVVDGIAAGAADADDGDARLQVDELWKLQLDAHRVRALPPCRDEPAAFDSRLPPSCPSLRETVFNHCRRARSTPPAPRGLVPEPPRIPHAATRAARNRRERGCTRLAAAPKGLRPRHAYRTPERVGGKLANPDELARPAGQHHTLARPRQ